MVSNRELTTIFRTLSELLMLHGDKENLSKYFAGAAFRITKITEEVMHMSRHELQQYFSKSIISKIEELNKTGTINIMDELIQLTPPGIFEMMRIKGLGGKKLAILWKKAGIDSMDALLAACEKNEIAQISGFGNKTQQNIISAIEHYKQSENSFHFATVEEKADKIIASLKRTFKTDKISLCGAVRRKTNTVSNLELIMAIPMVKFKSKKLMPGTLLVESSSKNEIKGHTIHEVPFTFISLHRINFILIFFRKREIKSMLIK
jgi:DNA polymerase (family 10)